MYEAQFMLKEPTFFLLERLTFFVIKLCCLNLN